MPELEGHHGRTGERLGYHQSRINARHQIPVATYDLSKRHFRGRQCGSTVRLFRTSCSCWCSWRCGSSRAQNARKRVGGRIRRKHSVRKQPRHGRTRFRCGIYPPPVQPNRRATNGAPYSSQQPTGPQAALLPSAVTGLHAQTSTPSATCCRDSLGGRSHHRDHPPSRAADAQWLAGSHIGHTTALQ